MFSHLNATVVRRLARTAALTPVILLPLVAAPAFADVPEGWEQAEPVSPLYAILLLAGVPLLLIAGITFLVYVPSFVRGEKYQPGLAWHNENEWFGGPSGGVDSVDRIDREAIEPGQGADSDSPDIARGGASARW